MSQNTEEQSIYPNSFRTNRRYKDRLFRVVFSDKRDLLDLYNAVNRTEYTDPDDLEVNTLEDVIYLSMKNDISFLIGGTLNLYEHQSSVNPNMPMRGLLYFARLYEQYANARNLNFYSRTLQKVPRPIYLVFYNGTEEEPDEGILRLSDAFDRPEPEPPNLECVVRVLNINYGHNRALLERCRRLWEYAVFVSRVREKLEEGAVLEAAVEQAIDSCIGEGILKEILTKQRAEVVGMILHMEWEEYEELMKKEYREEGRKEGHEEGLKEGLEEGHEKGRKEGLEAGREEGIRAMIKLCEQLGADEDTTVERLMEGFGLTAQEAREALAQCRKN